MPDTQYTSNVKPIDRGREKRPARTPNQVRILVVLDRSASMKPHEARVVESLGAFFALLRKGLPSRSECLLTLTQFDSAVEICALKQPLDTVPIRYKAVEGN